MIPFIITEITKVLYLESLELYGSRVEFPVHFEVVSLDPSCLNVLIKQ